MTSFFRILGLCAIVLSPLSGGSGKTPLDPANLAFEYIGVEQGLPQQSVFTILQDRQGFMWFGTRFGLSRYDGYAARNYLYDPDDSLSVPGYEIRSLAEDSSGGIWIGTSCCGLGYFDRVSEEVTRYVNDENSPGSLPDNRISSLLVSRSGKVYIGTVGGLAVFRPEDGSFKLLYPFSEPNREDGVGHVISIEEYPSGLINFGTYSGELFSFDESSLSWSLSFSGIEPVYVPKHPGEEGSSPVEAVAKLSPAAEARVEKAAGHRVEEDAEARVEEDAEARVEEAARHNEDPGTGGLQLEKIMISLEGGKIEPKRVRSLHRDREQELLWIGDFGQGLFSYDRSRAEARNYGVGYDYRESFLRNGIFSVTEDRSGRIWAAHIDGAFVLDKESGQWTRIPGEPGKAGMLNDKMVYSAYGDDDNIVWFGTESGGVNKLIPEGRRFDIMDMNSPDELALPCNMVFHLNTDSVGRILISTITGGLGRYDPGEGRMEVYQSVDIDPDICSKNFLACSQPVNDTLIYLGSFSCGLYALNPETAVYRQYFNRQGDINSLSDNDVYSLCRTRDGKLWVGTRTGGLNLMDEQRGEFTRFVHQPEDSVSLAGNLVYCMLEDRAGDLWIGTGDGGLDLYLPESGSFRHLLGDISRNGREICVLSIFESADSVLWVGTRSSGLFSLGPDREQALSVDLDIEGKELAIFSIIEDDHGTLWLATNMGIMSYDPLSGAIRRFGKEDGVQSEFYKSSAVRDSRGRIYFGGVSGINVFHPDSLNLNTRIPPVFITGISVNHQTLEIGRPVDGRILLTKAVTETETIDLYPGHRVISLRYSALNYRSPWRNRYAYMLQGFDRDWIDAADVREAQYMNLPPGQYRFVVIAANNDGTWNRKGDSLNIQVHPSLRQTAWFKFFIVLLILSVFVGIYRIRIFLLKKRHEQALWLMEKDMLQRELLTKSLHIQEKQSIMNNFSEDLKELLSTSGDQPVPGLRKIIQKYSGHELTDRNWTEFEAWFSKLHSGFSSDLSRAYPQLSPIELKVCALVRLNLVSKEIANLLNIKPSSVDIYRYRIRKKLSLSSEENLTSRLMEF